MKVKKFVASSMPEAMKMIRAELGNDAVILNSKVVHKKGFLGLFSRKNIEVIAAVDSKPELNVRKIKEKRKEEKPQVERVQDDRLLKEINELKTIMQKLSVGVATNFEHYPEPLREMNALLMEQEISDEIRQQLMSALLERWYLERATASKEEVKRWLHEEMVNKLSPFSFGGISFQKKFVNVVGPTGVGKTTTLAKMAAECVIKHQKKVAFITTDTYRIAAIDQLKTYAKILDVPLEVCYNLDDFRKAKEKFASYDIVFIDTAGRNFRNPKYVKDLQELIDFNQEMETFLVLSLTAKLCDMKEIYQQFSLIHIDKFIFTKVDETSRHGAMVNLMMDCQIGAAYLTHGQNVPDDIIEASPTIIANTIIGVEQR
ncbi:flagellar biosynthesis protein FlhF [Thermolongibacillus altinsuensis]|jgi:flagellar biosynthesis protein FlhF|uniref:Flagellar biosynthesis protein FlhF n=1 Tax=Thermolongibacillus altinsuensis TaxID=575256 RepID=A0A4R1QIM0_9BACL|nr:flagellar biosynthesis protein FlhF [Thermolongibacillus altinsuensis]TCL50390.1 flagellar biosynthesis protein FlhF [Thermolongibacillus altinsuensis]GMB08442.1 flagellar biosynthesis protein FlhF [Thermolongibacillus altinsuensis]